MQIKAGSSGYSGKRAVNANTMFDELFSVTEDSTLNTTDEVEDTDEVMKDLID